MNKYLKNEIINILNSIEDLENLSGKTILITGGTGFIGQYLVRVLDGIGVKVIAIARNEEKVKSMEFNNNIKWFYRNLNNKILINDNIDYIIHTASPTDSKYFIDKPVEVINDTLCWLNNIATFGLEKKVKGIVFLSSLEVYGICLEDRFLTEKEYFSIDCNNVRNSYSEGKKILECLCSSYAKEYNLPIKIVRLGQTFGPGISIDDNRVFAQFAKAIIQKNDIVLSTKGETKRSYCSIKDAIIGIIKVLLYGKNGEAYNLASDNSYFSIYEMAKMFIKNTNQQVLIKESNNLQYLGTLKFGLNTDKIKALGFKSYEGLEIMVKKLLCFYCEEYK